MGNMKQLCAYLRNVEQEIGLEMKQCSQTASMAVFSGLSSLKYSANYS